MPVLNKTKSAKSPAKKSSTAKKSSRPKTSRKSPVARPTANGSAAVDAYLAAVPPAQRAALERLREIIKSAAPAAEEVISYRIPLFKHHGHLVGFAAFKNHCTLFVMNLHTIKAHAAALKGFTTAPSGIHFTPEKPLPAALVKKLVKVRMAENEKSLTASVGNIPVEPLEGQAGILELHETSAR